ncbi:Insulin-like growth factor-binding protein 7 [Sciurus carolinensis]|uniref:Insulin-like growth factor-binding protein 7 n=1 Tax=Sciurus carolinensis TaxID=30640 RepID=A0AA41N112_SCICA|nr:Insulin-like growth factor-binding protein 7 [Sciurus carolinensis]
MLATNHSIVVKQGSSMVVSVFGLVDGRVGYPPPHSGRQVQRGHYGVQRIELLPGDWENLAIETQGGQEKHEVSPLSKKHDEEEECHTSESQGQASDSEKITVVDALHEIPVKKMKVINLTATQKND